MNRYWFVAGAAAGQVGWTLWRPSWGGPCPSPTASWISCAVIIAVEAVVVLGWCWLRGYATRKDAKDVIREMRRQGKVRDTAQRIDAYRCETDPDFWHVGHTTHRRPNLNDPMGA